MITRAKFNRSDDLDALLRHAMGYAEHMMATAGSVPPTLMAATPEGFLMFVPKSLKDVAEKDKFANAGRLLAVAHKATAVALVLETWATSAKRPGPALPQVPPSQSPDRVEVVVIMAEARGVKAQQFLSIQRDSRGKFAWFGTSPEPEFNEMEGRFAQMMPPKKPSDKDAQMAKMRLTAMGIIVERKGQNPMWN